MPWTARHLSTRQRTIAGGAASLALLLMVLAASAWFDLAALESAPTAQPLTYSGVLHRDRLRIRVQPASGPALDCPTAQCGYRGAREDHGKQGTVSVAGGRILEVEVAGVRRNVHAEAITAKQDTVAGAVFGVLVAACVVAITLLRGRRRK